MRSPEPSASLSADDLARTLPRVGFVGLGAMGRGMVDRIVAAGFPVIAYARRPDALEQFSGRVEIAPSMAELARRSNVIGICVYGDADVRQVMLDVDGALAGAAAGTSILIHSTVDPRTCTELASLAAEQGVHVLDAPISGGPDGAAAGVLVSLVGGDAVVLDACRPVLEAFSSAIVHVGPVGSAQIAKLLNNLLFSAQAGLVCDVLELGARLGIPNEALLDVLEHGSGRSTAALAFRRFGSFQDLLEVCQPLRKDLVLVEELAAPHEGVPAAVQSSAQRFARLL